VLKGTIGGEGGFKLPCTRWIGTRRGFYIAIQGVADIFASPGYLIPSLNLEGETDTRERESTTRSALGTGDQGLALNRSG
jgi:hypothetical protein